MKGELFCHIDDFCQQFEPRWREQLLSHGLVKGINHVFENLALHYHHPGCTDEGSALGHVLEFPAKMNYDAALWTTINQSMYWGTTSQQ